MRGFGWLDEGFWAVSAGGRYNLWKNLPANTRNPSFVSSFVISKKASEEPLSKTIWVVGERFWVVGERFCVGRTGWEV